MVVVIVTIFTGRGLAKLLAILLCLVSDGWLVRVYRVWLTMDEIKLYTNKSN